MKPSRSIRTGLLALAVVVIAAGCGCGKEKGRKQGMSAKGAMRSPPAAEMPAGMLYKCEDELADIGFVIPADGTPPRIGFAVGRNSTIIRTTDGGRTWRRTIPRQDKGDEFTAVFTSSAGEAWAVSLQRLLHSADGGLTWKPAVVLPGQFYHYGHAAVRPGIYYQMQPPTCGATVWHTADGAGWKRMPANTPRNDYGSICVLDDSHAWVVGNYGHMALTTDGGQTWRENNIPKGGNLAQVQFVNQSEGWIRVSYGHEGRLWHSADGGQSWQRQSLPIESFWTPVDMQFIDAQRGWMLIDAGKHGSQLLRTTDGGATWSIAHVYPRRAVALSMAGADHGWIAAVSGEIFECTGR